MTLFGSSGSLKHIFFLSTSTCRHPKHAKMHATPGRAFLVLWIASLR